MIEQIPAQVILDAFTQDPDQVDENENKHSLHQLEPTVIKGISDQCGDVFRDNALVNDQFIDIREQGIGCRGHDDCRQEAGHPTPMRLDQPDDPVEGRGGQLAGIFLLFNFQELFRHRSSFRLGNFRFQFLVDASLYGIYPPVHTVLSQEVFMTAFLNDPAFIHDKDQIGIHYRLYPMGDDEGGTVLHQ